MKKELGTARGRLNGQGGPNENDLSGNRLCRTCGHTVCLLSADGLQHKIKAPTECVRRGEAILATKVTRHHVIISVTIP